MDRPCVPRPLRLAGCLLALALASSAGCRSTKSEVPPGRPYARTGDQPPAVGFSSEPHPAVANGSPNTFNVGPGGSTDDQLGGLKPKPPVYGTPTAGEKVSRPTTNSYGPPGTTGLDPTAGPSPGTIADELLDTGESTAKSLTRDLQAIPASAPQ